MGIQIADLRTKLRKATGTDSADLPDIDADLLLNQAYWELLDKFPFREKEVRGTFETIVGTRSYNAPSPFEALRHLAIRDLNSPQHTPLDQMGLDVYEQQYNEEESSRGKPTHYVREGCQIVLFPTPDDIYTITIRYLTVLADLSTTQNPNIPQSWHEIILLGGIWREFVELGDWQRVMAAKSLQQNLINSSVPEEAKEEVDTRRAALEVLRNEYSV